MSKYKIRRIKDSDIQRVLEIYAPYILNTTITYEYDVPTLESFTDRVNNIKSKFPYFVCECDGKIVGYAYASAYHSRTAFNWDCELSIYLDNSFCGKGIGRRLYAVLIDFITEQGFYNAYGVVSYPNHSSERLHDEFGFYCAGIHKNVGFKFNKWLDLIYYIKPLREFDQPKTFPKNANDIYFKDIEWED